MTVTAVTWRRRRILWAGHVKSADFFEIDDKSCALAHPMESDVAMHTYLGSTIMDRMFHCPLHDRYVRYIISCTRSVAIVVAPPRALGPVFLFLFSPAPPPAPERQAPHLPRIQFRSARAVAPRG